ncbi:two-component sensor histidine kinase [Rhizobium sp. PP-F2F-G36]|nr:two-component sensor histidine kinase [Rhizobium sp. PP-F2F-G36]
MPDTRTDFAAIFRGMPQPYLVLDAELLIVGASDVYLALTDRSLDDIVGRHILEAFPENPEEVGSVEQGPLEVSLRHVLATGRAHEMAVIQYDIPKPGGGFTQKFWTPVHSPVLGADGSVEYIIQNPMDVTESVIASREADARLRVAMHAANLASWEYEPETDSFRRGHLVDRMFGFAPGEGGPIAAPFYARLHEGDLAKVRESVDAAMSSVDQTVIETSYRIVWPDRTVRHVISRGEVMRTSTGQVRLIGVLMDVTADRNREAELADAVARQAEFLEEKDRLLAELNHRVKNSLQLVVSTLRLQARRVTDDNCRETLNRAVARVRAIVSVHERLYRDKHALSVDMAEHLLGLCLDVAGSEGQGFAVDVDPVRLQPEAAIPVSVIVNELISRLVQSNDEKIVVSLRESGGGMLTLSVAGRQRQDDDDGLLDVGRRIIAAVAAQIRANFTETSTDERYQAKLVFRKDAS